MSKLETVADVVRWLGRDVEWADEASRDRAAEAVDVLTLHFTPRSSDVDEWGVWCAPRPRNRCQPCWMHDGHGDGRANVYTEAGAKAVASSANLVNSKVWAYEARPLPAPTASRVSD